MSLARHSRPSTILADESINLPDIESLGLLLANMANPFPRVVFVLCLYQINTVSLIFILPIYYKREWHLNLKYRRLSWRHILRPLEVLV